MTNRILRYSGLGLAVLTAGAIAACSSSDPANPPAGGAGNGSGGAHAGGAGGAPSTAGSTAAGSAGLATAGAATAGAGGAAPGFPCAGALPASALITEFADLVANPTSAGNYTFMAGVPGGTFTYQPNALTLDITGAMLNIKGNVHAYDGFGVYFNGCTDASAYTGVSFNIKGNAGSKGTLSFRVQTNANTAIDTPNKKGSCVATATDTYAECHSAMFNIPVSSAGGVVSVNFSQLTGGAPIAGVNGKDIVGLEWAFNWDPNAAAGGAGSGGASGGSGGASAGAGGASAGAAGKGGSGSGGASGGSGGSNPGSGGASGGSGGAIAGSYDANITIDDIKFIGGPPAGGAGGASGSGAGGASGGSGGASGGSGGSSSGAGGKAGSGG